MNIGEKELWTIFFEALNFLLCFVDTKNLSLKMKKTMLIKWRFSLKKSFP